MKNILKLTKKERKTLKKILTKKLRKEFRKALKKGMKQHTVITGTPADVLLYKKTTG